MIDVLTSSLYERKDPGAGDVGEPCLTGLAQGDQGPGARLQKQAGAQGPRPQKSGKTEQEGGKKEKSFRETQSRS